jgi:Fic family protein
LEGASTTRKVAEAMLREGRKPRDHSERMIFNNFTAMQTIRTLRDDPITPERILELHRMLAADTLDDPQDTGRLRRSDDVRVVDNRDGTLLHQPPPFRELPKRLEHLCRFANAAEDSAPFVHPVLRAILLHFMIGYDHPFADGNGRTARALFYWSMARSGYWLTEFLSISHFLRRAPTPYVRAYLHTETDGNDTTYFLLHQLELIRRAIELLHDYLARASEAQHATERMLASSPALRERLNHRQIDLLTHALQHPGENYLVEGHQRTHGVVYQTARTDLLALAEQGLLTKSRVGRAFVFSAPTDLQRRMTELAGRGRGGKR